MNSPTLRSLPERIKKLTLPVALGLLAPGLIMGQEKPSTSIPAPASPPASDPAYRNGPQLAPSQAQPSSVEDVLSDEVEKVVDSDLLPIAMRAVQLRPGQQPASPELKVRTNNKAADTVVQQVETVRPSQSLIRGRLIFALSSLAKSPTAGPSTNLARSASERIRTSPEPLSRLAAVRNLSPQDKERLVRSLLGEGERIAQPRRAGAEAAAPENTILADAAPGQVLYYSNMTWDKDINWSANPADSNYTFTSTFSQPGRENGVWTRLEYKWSMTGDATVWPETLGANGTWYNSVSPDGMHIADFSSYYRNRNGDVFSTLNRMNQNFEAQNRIRWRLDGNGTIQHWHMEGDWVQYVAPDESGRTAYGAVPRTEGQTTQSISTGMTGWQNVEESRKKSSGLVMDPAIEKGRIAANKNTGINGGDYVYLSLDGIIEYVTTEGFYFFNKAPDLFRASFVPADGSAPETLYSYSFPRTFTKRGSLYFYVAKPDWEPKWTPNYGRGGIVINTYILRASDVDKDGLTDYEETNGIAGYKTGQKRYSSSSQPDTDKDTVSDFDEVFGWEYKDKRAGTDKLRNTDTDPRTPDDFYARTFLKNATLYKAKFRQDGVTYTGAVSLLTPEAEQDLGTSFNAFRSISTATNTGGILDAVYEKAMLELLRGQESQQAAYDTRFSSPSATAIKDELDKLDKALIYYDQGINAFIGQPKESPFNGTLLSYHQLFQSLGPQRKPWDKDVGEDVNQLQPYRELERLAKLSAGRLEILEQESHLLYLRSEAETAGQRLSKDQARQKLVGGLARNFLLQTLLEDQLPPGQFNTQTGMVELLNMNSQAMKAERSYALLDRNITNALGIDRNFVKFIFNPSDDPDKTPGNPANNFLQFFHDLSVTGGSLERATTAESEVLAAKRDFEINTEKFANEMFQTKESYGRLLDTYNLDFENTKSQVEKNFILLDKARNELKNIYSRILIEQDRVARKAGIQYEFGQQLAQVHLETGEDLAANELALGDINAIDAGIQGFIQMQSSVSFGFPSLVSVNPGQMLGGLINMVWGPIAAEQRAQIAASNQRIQALEKARVTYLNVQLTNALEQADSEAHIKSMLLEVENANLDVRLRLLDLSQSLAHMQELANLINETKARRQEAEALIGDLYANPWYRLVRDHTRERAQILFSKAQEDVFLAGRALEYETTKRSVNLQKVFTTRSSKELADVLAGFKSEWDNFSASVGARVPTHVIISVRKDILGFKYGDVDPVTHAPIDPIVRFRKYLHDTSPAANVYQIQFYGSMNEWRDPSAGTPPPQVWGIPRTVFNTKLQSISVHLVGEEGDGKLGNATAAIFLNLGGHGWVRSVEGTKKPSSTETQPWKVPENIVKVLAIRYAAGPSGVYNIPVREIERTVPVKVGTQPAPSGPDWGLFNQSPIRKWILTLNLNDSGNTDINIDALEDIEIELQLKSNELPSIN